MRRVMIGVLATMMCASYGFGQRNGQPQWKVILEKHVSNGTDEIPKTVILMPSRGELYRLTAYMSAIGTDNVSAWQAEFDWTDSNGKSTFALVGAGDSDPGNSITLAFSPLADSPVMLSVYQPGGKNATYDFGFTVERLTH